MCFFFFFFNHNVSHIVSVKSYQSNLCYEAVDVISFEDIFTS
jgi:hypothetical protein